MIQYMSTQYAYPVSIEQMSESLGYNRAYLSRIFKQETGLTPVTYLLKLRIDKSRQLLRERPDLSIEQVSASVGMPDALYFSVNSNVSTVKRLVSIGRDCLRIRRVQKVRQITHQIKSAPCLYG